MVEVSAAEVQRNFGVYREKAEGTRGAAEPVIVMHYNKPSVVIIAAEDYARLKQKDRSLMDAEAMPSVPEIEASKSATVARRLGFLAGEISVPEDFDQMGAEEIARLFGTEP